MLILESRFTRSGVDFLAAVNTPERVQTNAAFLPTTFLMT
jgi:hypothetical protein